MQIDNSLQQFLHAIRELGFGELEVWGVRGNKKGTTISIIGFSWWCCDGTERQDLWSMQTIMYALLEYGTEK